MSGTSNKNILGERGSDDNFFLMCLKVIGLHGKMVKLKYIKHNLNKNNKIYANIFSKISKLANFV